MKRKILPDVGNFVREIDELDKKKWKDLNSRMDNLKSFAYNKWLRVTSLFVLLYH